MTVVIDGPNSPASSIATEEGAAVSADAAVEIARIEGETEITLAEIAAETTQTALELEAAETDEDELQWLDERLARLDDALAQVLTMMAETLSEVKTLKALQLEVMVSPASVQTMPLETPEPAPVKPEALEPAPLEKAAGRKESPAAAEVEAKRRKWL